MKSILGLMIMLALVFGFAACTEQPGAPAGQGQEQQGAGTLPGGTTSSATMP